MNPQGSQLVNTAAIDSLIAKIRAAKNPVDLSQYAQEAMQPVNAKLGIVQAELQALAPYLALLNPPSPTPQAIVTWITGMIGVNIAPQVAAYTSYVAQVTVLAAKAAELQQAIEDAAARFDNLSIDLPALPVIDLPSVPEVGL